MKRRTNEWILLLLFILLGAALRLHRLGAESLWYDETVSVLLATKPIGAMLAHTARDIHPPLYYLLLNVWVRFAGTSEFAVAWPSWAAGVLLLPATYMLGVRVLRRRDMPLMAVALLSIAPYHIWYSQEVRMYTLGALWALLAGYAAWGMLMRQQAGEPVARGRQWRFFVLFSALGLYTHYYFAFWLAAIGIALLVILWKQRLALRPWLEAAAATLLLWLPWLPIAVRQAIEPPVPPWRSKVAFPIMVLETITTLAAGHSIYLKEIMESPLVVALLYVVIVLYVIGCVALARRSWQQFLFLIAWTWGPFLIIALISLTITPLYHVRYMFLYSPPFYLVLAVGMVTPVWQMARGLSQRRRVVQSVAALFLTSAFAVWGTLAGISLNNFWYNPAYAADDYRSAMRHLQELWAPGDVLLANAGYVYPVVNYYFKGPIAWQGRLTAYREPLTDANGLIVLQTGSFVGPPSLGWGNPESDFYLTSPEETIAHLEHLAQHHTRLWVLQAYDTVTDPHGVIRAWLEEHATLFYDEVFTGITNARLQGWLLDAAWNRTPRVQQNAVFTEPDTNRPIIELAGYDPPPDIARGGDHLAMTLYVRRLDDFAGTLRLSMGIFDATGRQWPDSVRDFAPLGPQLLLNDLPVGTLVPVPVRVPVPVGLPPDGYEVRLKFYRAEDGRSLGVQSFIAVNNEQIRMAGIVVLPTPANAPLPTMSRMLNVEVGPLELLGVTMPSRSFQPGEIFEVELLWRVHAPLPASLTPSLADGRFFDDDGGLARRLPLDQWPADALIRDIHHVMVRPDAPPGDAPLALRVMQGSVPIELGGLLRGRSAVNLGTITIVDRPRLFEEPPVDVRMDADFDGEITLVGYTIENADLQPGGSLTLTLVWKAERRPSQRYKVFTHLVGPQGNIRGQRDLEPGDGTLPTIGWAPGEYVVMTYDVPIAADAPAGAYDLRVGLYNPETFARVPINHPQANPQEHYLSLTTLEIR